MANRFNTPNPQFIGNDGLPYAGGWLYFYATETDDPLDVYSDEDLTIARTNPIELDSDGGAGSVFLQNLPYKVVLEDSDHNQIWTEDPVYSSDYSALAQFRPWNGDPNGLVAGYAGTQGALPGSSVVWDYLNNVLYVCTFTGNAATAIWTAMNGDTSSPNVPSPQGLVTVASDATFPVVQSDTTSSTIYYTPYVGNLVPVYNGSTFAANVFTQLTLGLTASHVTLSLYDVFVFNNSGVLTLVTGPAWSTITPGSGARGTGAGTTQLQRLNGLFVNAVQITGRNGATTYTIPANTATFLSTIYIDSGGAAVTCHRGFGQTRKFGVWNAYNRLPIKLKGGDATANWTAGAVFAAANANSANCIDVLCGLPEEMPDLRYHQLLRIAANGATSASNIGIGKNSTSINSASTGTVSINSIDAIDIFFSTTAAYEDTPFIGVNRYTMLCSTPNPVVGDTFFGTETSMHMVASYMG